MVHRRAAVLLAITVLGFACGCACVRDWRPFGRRSDTAGCPCGDFAESYGDGPLLEGGGPIMVQPGPMATGNGACANGQPSVVQPPRLIAEPQAANTAPYTPSKNNR